MKPKIKTAEMEVALAQYFDYRANLIVPNVHWGMNMHECDLLVVSKAGYCTEVEIKVTRADLRADSRKKHCHDSGVGRRIIKYLYFAIPAYLDHCLEFVPERAGVILVRPKDDNYTPRCRKIRDPQVNRAATKVPDHERYQIARLGALRVWNLKRKLV